MLAVARALHTQILQFTVPADARYKSRLKCLAQLDECQTGVTVPPPILAIINFSKGDLMSKKIIAIIGATGAQGGSLAHAILNDKNSEFTVRAITRKLDSDKAKALAAAGAELVQADLDDAASLRKAFAGAHGVFAVTNFWEHFSPEKEMAHAKNMAQAAKDAAVSHVVWSTLEDTRKLVPLTDARMPTLMEHYKVPHFDAKGASDHFFSDFKVPTTNLVTSFYWDNLVHFGMGPKKGPDGVLAFALPMADKRLPGIAAEDIGKCAYGIFKQPSQWIGKTVAIAGEHLTGKQMAEGLAHALEQPVNYAYIPPETYRTFDFPGAADLANMFQYKRDFEAQYVGARNLDVARSLNPELQTFAKWLSQNKSRIPLG